MVKENLFFKNLSICRLLLLSSSSSWDFCWMQSKHIENDSGGIFYLLSSPSFLHFHFLLSVPQFLYVQFLLLVLQFFHFLQTCINLSHVVHMCRCFQNQITPFLFLAHMCALSFLFTFVWPSYSPLSYLKPIVWSSFKLPFDLLPSPQLFRSCPGCKSKQELDATTLWPQPQTLLKMLTEIS